MRFIFFSILAEHTASVFRASTNPQLSTRARGDGVRDVRSRSEENRCSMRSAAFTLIELLVVIAIIGILSSVVLASLNAARGKGSNAAIKSQLAAIRPQAEIYYDTNGSYGTSTTVTAQNASLANGCSTAITASLFVDPTINNQIKSLVGMAGAGNVVCMVTPTGNNTTWSVTSILKVAEGANTYWCADSTGASKGEASPLSTAACP